MPESVDQTKAVQKTSANEVVLSHAIALTGELSNGAFHQAVEQVRTLAMNGPIYPPDEFPSLSQRVATTITNVASGSDAPLSTYEAVGVSILLQEAAALAQAFAVNDTVANQLNDILGNVDRGLSQGDIIEGFIGFLVQIKNVAGIRKLIEMGFDTTPRPYIDHIIKVRRIKDYISELELDNYTFGENVLSKIVDVVKNGMNENLNSSQRTDPKTVAIVCNSREKGANLARDLFVEATNLAEIHL